MNILVTIKTEAERALSDLDAAIKEFGKLKKATDKNSQVVKCNQLLSRCKNQVDSYKLELRGPQIPEDQKPALREELSQLQTTMKKLIAELDYCKMEHKKRTVGRGQSSAAGRPGHTRCGNIGNSTIGWGQDSGQDRCIFGSN